MQTLYICGFLFVTYFQVSLGYLPDEYLQWDDKQCIRELNIEKETVQAAFDDDFILEEGNPIINAFVECSFKKAYYMNQDGSLNLANIKEWARRDFFRVLKLQHVLNQDKIVDKAVTQCEIIKGINNADTAVKTYNCIMGFIKEESN